MPLYSLSSCVFCFIDIYQYIKNIIEQRRKYFHSSSYIITNCYNMWIMYKHIQISMLDAAFNPFLHISGKIMLLRNLSKTIHKLLFPPADICFIIIIIIMTISDINYTIYNTFKAIFNFFLTKIYKESF